MPKKKSPKDIIVRLPDFQADPVLLKSGSNLDWSHEYYKIKELHDKGYRGEGVVIAVLDTGVELTHDSFKKALSEGRLESYDARENRADPTDRQGHGCITPDSRVFTTLLGTSTIESFFKEAEDFGIFREDLNVDGNVSYEIEDDIKTISWDGNKFIKSKITHAHKFPFKGDLVVVETNEDSLRLTPWHPVYVVSSRRGSDLTVIKKRADELIEGDSILCANGVDLNEGRYRSVGDFILDENLAYFAGLVASDGHITSKGGEIRFCNNDDLLIQAFIDLAALLFDKEVKENKTRDGNSREVVLYSTEVKKLLVNLGIPSGNKSRTFTLPNVITKSPLKVILAFYSGMLDGDGSISKKDSRVRLISGSKSFCEDTVSLFNTLGYNASFFVNSKNGFNNNPDKVSICYAIRLPKLDYSLRGYKKDIYIKDEHKVRKSRSITNIFSEAYDGPMYDFTIDKTKNYISNSGYIVSNTWVVSRYIGDDSEVLGFAPNAKVISIKVLNDNGSGVLQDIIRGVELALSLNVDIISSSIGWPNYVPYMDEIVGKVKSTNTLWLSAAGNDGTKEDIDYPALYPDIISVGSINQNIERASHSDFGADLDLYSSGEGVKGAWVNNRTAFLKGTSMATPSLGGLIAILWSDLVKDGAVDREALKKIATCL